MQVEAANEFAYLHVCTGIYAKKIEHRLIY